MPSTVFDSFYFRDRFATGPMRELWDDRATLQRWLDVEAALALVEAELGLIPETAAVEIAAHADIGKLDLGSMKAAFDATWNPVVPLIEELRKAISPDAACYVHWGATSKNIFDTGMVLQIKDSYQIVLADLDAIADQLAALAAQHRDTVMAGRTHGQHAIPITFGFKVAAWLDEVDRQIDRLVSSRPRVLVGEFGGSVGTLAALGEQGLEVQDRLMKRLGLGSPAIPVKTAGDRVAEFALLLCMISATLGKIAQNIYNLQQTDIDEVAEFTEGKIGSSAMPHKQNPVASGSVVFLGRLLRSNAQPALDYIQGEWEDDHRQGETAWKFVPEICLLASAQLAIMRRLLVSLVVKPANMRRNLDRGGGVTASETLMMTLAARIGRGRAHELVGELARQSHDRGVSFRELVAAHPEIISELSPGQISDCFDYTNSLGLAPVFVDRLLAAHRQRRSQRGA